MKKVMLFILVLTVIFVALTVVKNALTPKPLNVSYSKQDYYDVRNRMGYSSSVINTTAKVTALNSISDSGAKQVDVRMTQAEVNALLDHWSEAWKYAPFTNSAVKLNDDRFEYTGTFSFDRAVGYASATGISQNLVDKVSSYIKPLGGSFPVYINGDFEITNNQVEGNIETAKIGFISVPKNWIDSYQEKVNSFVADRISRKSEYKVESLSISNGSLNFKGVIPEKVVYYR